MLRRLLIVEWSGLAVAIVLGGVVLALESATRERLFLPPVASIDGASGEVR